MIHYGRAPFLDRFPRSRVPVYPSAFRATEQRSRRGRRRPDRLRDGLRVRRRGHRGHARRSRSDRAAVPQHAVPGWISEDPGVSFVDLEKLIGLKAARHAFQAWRRAALDFSALLRRLDIKCHLEPHSALTVAITPEQVARLKSEQKARRDAGLETPALNARAVSAEVALSAAFALRGRDGATIDPYRACARAGGGRGRARRADLRALAGRRGSRSTGRRPTCITAGGTIRARRVVVATAMPSGALPVARAAFLVSRPLPGAHRARAREDPPASSASATTVVRDSPTPPHVVRWVDDERLLVAGPTPRRRPSASARRPSSSGPVS